ncbi:MAG: RNA 2'-phosphotransferase [Fusobacterium sp.]|nr:RNA 2'-phosphotransferase [Fusobacterium sp.]
MNETKFLKLSKFISLVLRHKPEQIGISLDKNGWANTNELIEKIKQTKREIDLEILEEIVKKDNKTRFVFNEDKSKIRANQGHTVKIDLGYEVKEPPEFLYHGTATKFIESIKEVGIQKKNRHHVHLSKDIETATMVGKRHGEVVILKIFAKEMNKAGNLFYESDNGVWLVDEVPTKFFEIIDMSKI